MSLKREYEIFSREIVPAIAIDEPNRCPCSGSGWILSPFDTWEQCPIHFDCNKPHPEEDYPIDEGIAVVEEVDWSWNPQDDEDNIPF